MQLRCRKHRKDTLGKGFDITIEIIVWIFTFVGYEYHIFGQRLSNTNNKPDEEFL